MECPDCHKINWVSEDEFQASDEEDADLVICWNCNKLQWIDEIAMEYCRAQNPEAPTSAGRIRGGFPYPVALTEEEDCEFNKIEATVAEVFEIKGD